MSNSDFIFSQVTQEWIARYSRATISNNGATAIVADDSGNVYVTGASQGAGTGSDYATIKYNSNGFRQWVRIYNGPGNGQDIANAIIIDNDGNVYITGSSEGISSGTDFATIKYSSLRDQLWVARYTSVGNNLDAGYKIAFDNSNNIYVTGESNGDYATIKYNSSGNEQWIRRYSNGIAYSITVDDSSNVYVTGRGSGDCVTIKYDSSGFQKWISRYNGQANGDDFALSIGIDSLGNIYVA